MGTLVRILWKSGTCVEYRMASLGEVACATTCVRSSSQVFLFLEKGGILYAYS